jgi:exodeoxyribonuclease V alpha subunit
MFEELQGQLEHITYCNEVNHYTIAKIRVKGLKELITVVGNLISISPGEELRLKGMWEVHSKYGRQFKIASYETVLPATINGIERYLGSGFIKGIGPVMAKRVVDRFGLETLNILETDIKKLSEVAGIGEKRIDMIKTAWAEQKEIRNLILFLQSHEVGSGYASKIYKHYGKAAINVIKENPYRLARDIHGIGFMTADKFAEKMGIPKDSPARAEAGILHVLRKFADEGHVYYPYKPLIEECKKILGGQREIIVKAFGKLVQEKMIIIEDLNINGIAENNKAVYLPEFHVSETGLAKSLTSILNAPKSLIRIDHEKAVESAQKELNIVLTGNQIKAVTESLNKKVMVITGGPGTGKTTLINNIIKIYRRSGQHVLLTAPTGRAAKRMSEATGYEAKTIHRLLEYSPRDGGFKKNESHKLDADLIVIDEASMVDTILMHHLLKAVQHHATIIFVGDVDQLPSVGAGNVLKDIIESGCATTVRLKEIFRQAQESIIVVNAHRVNKGEFPFTESNKDVLQDFYFIELEEAEKATEMILNMCKDRIPKRFGYHPVDEIQVLTPMHRGLTGTINLNTLLQKELNPSTDEFVRGGRIFKTGDKVMQIANNYDRDVYNGDIGRISKINREEQEMTIILDGRSVAYDFADLDEIVLAYAVSVHKSQGSEYPAVIVPLLTEHYMLLQRNLLYTAITRGKKLVVLIGTKKAVSMAIGNNKPLMRYSRLKYRLQSNG